MIQARADEIAWGFVTRRLPPSQDTRWTFIESVELAADEVVQFCRVRVHAEPEGLEGDFCIIGGATFHVHPAFDRQCWHARVEAG